LLGTSSSVSAFTLIPKTSPNIFLPSSFPPRHPTTRLNMFTGIVEEMGTITSVLSTPVPSWSSPGDVVPGYVFTVSTSPEKVALRDSYIGASIAVSGVCLTATSIDGEGGKFDVGVSEETLRLTTLGHLVDALNPGVGETAECNERVNLERAAAIGGRNSGHNVQGHVDCTAEIKGKKQDGDSIVYTFAIPAGSDLHRYIVKKGFIAIDGTSLTVTETKREDGEFLFSIMMVRHTQECVIMTRKGPGDFVNIEVDVAGKFVSAAVEQLEERVRELEKEVKLLRGSRYVMNVKKK